jgi:hypothetical protein
MYDKNAKRQMNQLIKGSEYLIIHQFHTPCFDLLPVFPGEFAC